MSIAEWIPNMIKEGRSAPHITGALILLWAGSIGGASYFKSNFARAEDLKTVIAGQQQTVQELKDLSVLVKQATMATLSGQLRLLIAQRCKSTDSELRKVLNDQIEALERQYQSVAGFPYDRPECGDL